MKTIALQDAIAMIPDGCEPYDRGFLWLWALQSA